MKWDAHLIRDQPLGSGHLQGGCRALLEVLLDALFITSKEEVDPPCSSGKFTFTGGADKQNYIKTGQMEARKTTIQPQQLESYQKTKKIDVPNYGTTIHFWSYLVTIRAS